MRRTAYPLTATGLALAAALSLPAVRAAGGDLFDLNREPVLPKDLNLWTPSADGPAQAPRADRIRLFRIQPAFPSDPVGLEDDPLPPDAPPAKDDGPNWLQLSVGNDNPFFDLRYAGDPGGIGYTRVNTQLQVVNSPSTGCTIGFQAVTPAGAQSGGIEDGPTFISPAFSVFQTLGDGTAFQGFVAKNLHVSNPAGLGDTFSRTSQFGRSLQYGMAVQRPVLPEVNNLYLFVEALGRYRYDQTTAPTATPATWDVVPGMHLKMSDSWWLSGGVILPVNRDRPLDARLWQITCSFQF